MTLEDKPKTFTPPKGWEEITSDEKIERLREIVKNIQFGQNNISSSFQWLRDIFFKHSHGEDNKIMVEADKYPNGNGLGGTTAGNTLSSNKPYF